MYKKPVKFSLSLDMNPGTSNPTNGSENFDKNGKTVIPRKVLLFYRKISSEMNRFN